MFVPFTYARIVKYNQFGSGISLDEQKRKFEMFKRQTIRDTDANANVLTHIDTTAVWTVTGFINAAEQVCCRTVRLVVSHESFNRFFDFLEDTIELALGNRIATSTGDFQPITDDNPYILHGHDLNSITILLLNGWNTPYFWGKRGNITTT